MLFPMATAFYERTGVSAFCKGKTKDGNRCGNRPSGGSAYCHVHANVGLKKSGLAAGLVAFLGHLVAPGSGGALVGAGAGLLLADSVQSRRRRKTRVFVSFDFDNDKSLKVFLIGQSKLKDSPFSVDDYSLKEAAPERDWQRKARAAIKRSDVVLVMVGPKTYRASGVLAEVRIAREEGKPIVQMIGYRTGDYKRVKGAGHLYDWNWENLTKIFN